MRILWMMMVLLLLIPLVQGIGECKGVMDKGDIPCMIIGVWQFPNSCSTYTINIFNSNTTLIDVKTMGEYGATGRCNVTFNYTAQDSYLLNWSSGDSSKIIVQEDEDMILGMVIGIGIIASLLLFLAFKLEDEHVVLKLLLLFTSITLLILIPAQLVTGISETAFYKFTLYFFVAFWLYVGGYFVYWILKLFGVIVSGVKENE